MPSNKNIFLMFALILFLSSGFLLLPKYAHANTEILRPNDAGSKTSVGYQYPISTFHWDKVNEAVADDDTSYVYAANVSGNWFRVLYALSDHTGSGVINSVTVYARLKDIASSRSSGKISIRTASTTYDTSAYALTTSWADKSYTWTANASTSLPWTWAEIDALQAGVSLKFVGGGGSAPSILKGQPVLMADGSQKNIEDIKVGDEVLSFNLDSKKAEKDKVIGLSGGPHDDYLIFNGTLKASLNHVIWSNGEYKPAEDIKVGEFLTNSQGQSVEVTNIEHVVEKVDTYDLDIEKNHNFFVSNYLVHNATDTQGWATQVYVVVDYTPSSHTAMYSSHYAIQSDSINFAGNLSTSTSYRIQDTLGELGTGISSSTNYVMNAGYQQMLQSYIAISVSSTTATLPAISGLAGGTSTTSSTWTVITDNPAGYSLSAVASNAPAMTGDHGDNIADYVPAGAVPDMAFTILSTQSAFGFSPAGVNVVARYLNNGAICGTGVVSTLNSCWDGFSTTPKIIAQSATANQPSGATTTTVYQAQIGSSKIQTSGSYSATITMTAVTL